MTWPAVRMPRDARAFLAIYKCWRYDNEGVIYAGNDRKEWFMRGAQRKHVLCKAASTHWRITQLQEAVTRRLSCKWMCVFLSYSTRRAGGATGLGRVLGIILR